MRGLNKILFCFWLIVILVCSCKNRIHSVSNTKIISDTLQVKKSAIDIDTVSYSINPIQVKSDFDFEPNYYQEAFVNLDLLSQFENRGNFKKAVFTVENAWFNNSLDYNAYNDVITRIADVCKLWQKTNSIAYAEKDSFQVQMSSAIFKVLTDTVLCSNPPFVLLPFTYDFDDSFAEKDWQKMFVVKLLESNKGNCHSLPFLYKILADELETDAYLSFAPNHIFIKQYCIKTGWYNTELTNAMFPVDAWIMASGYVSVESVVSGIYMDTLGYQKSIAVCFNDLAKGYLRKFRNSPNLNFVIECCNKGLALYPNYAELLLLKAETLVKQYQSQKENKENIIHAAELCYSKLNQLHYKQVSAEMFREWITAMQRNKDIYNNQKINTIFNPTIQK